MCNRPDNELCPNYLREICGYPLALKSSDQLKNLSAILKCVVLLQLYSPGLPYYSWQQLSQHYTFCVITRRASLALADVRSIHAIAYAWR